MDKELVGYIRRQAVKYKDGLISINQFCDRVEGALRQKEIDKLDKMKLVRIQAARKERDERREREVTGCSL